MRDVQLFALSRLRGMQPLWPIPIAQLRVNELSCGESASFANTQTAATNGINHNSIVKRNCVIVPRDGPGGPSSILKPRVAKAAHERVTPRETLAILLDSLLCLVDAIVPRGDVSQIGQELDSRFMLFGCRSG